MFVKLDFAEFSSVKHLFNRSSGGVAQSEWNVSYQVILFCEFDNLSQILKLIASKSWLLDGCSFSKWRGFYIKKLNKTCISHLGKCCLFYTVKYTLDLGFDTDSTQPLRQTLCIETHWCLNVFYIHCTRQTVGHEREIQCTVTGTSGQSNTLQLWQLLLENHFDCKQSLNSGTVLHKHTWLSQLSEQ